MDTKDKLESSGFSDEDVIADWFHSEVERILSTYKQEAFNIAKTNLASLGYDLEDPENTPLKEVVEKLEKQYKP